MVSLVERGAELSQFEHRFDRVSRGTGQVVVVEGPVGVGKTALLRAFAEHAAGRGSALLSAVGSRAEHDAQPFATVQQLLQGVAVESGASSPTPRPGPGQGPGQGQGPGGPSIDRTPAPDGARLLELIEAITTYGSAPRREPEGRHALEARLCARLVSDVRRLAADRPVLIQVDQFDEIDDPSRRCLLYLVRRMTADRVMVVLSETVSAWPSAWPVRAELSRLAQHSEIALRPLSAHGVRRLLTDRLGRRGADPGLADQVHRVTGGNPLLVHATADDLQQAGDRSDPVGGDSTRRGLLSATHRCGPEGMRIALAVAVLDVRATATAVARLLGATVGTVKQHLEAMTRAGLLDGGRFRHPRARSCLLADADPGECLDLHRRAAGLLREDGAGPCAVAEQLVAADRADEPWATASLAEAAAQALVQGRSSAAVQYLRLAHRSCPPGPERTALTARLATAEWRLNPAIAARHLPDLIAATTRDEPPGPAAVTAVTAVTAVRILLWHGRVDEALATLDRIRPIVPDLDEPTAQALQATELWLRHLYPPSVDPPGARPGAGTTTGSRAGGFATDPPAARRLLQTVQLDDLTIGPVQAALTALVHAEELEAASAFCDLFLSRLEDRAPTWQALLTAIKAEIALRRGDLAAVLQLTGSALNQLPRHGWGVALGAVQACLVQAATATDRHERAAELLAQPIPRATFQTPYGLRYLRARGYHHLAVGRPHAALSDFRSCGERMVHWGMDAPSIVPWRSDAAQAWLRLEQPGRARLLVEEQLARVGDRDLRARGVSLRVLAAASGPRHRPELLRQAIDLLQRCDDRLELTRARADLTRIPRSVGGGGVPAPHRHPHRLAERRRMVELGPCPPASGSSGLSHAELKVANLAASGHTNREIAARLDITVSTVEQHLTRAYRKLQVGRRQDLAARLQEGLAGSA